jgi:hypothetical protein
MSCPCTKASHQPRALGAIATSPEAELAQIQAEIRPVAHA